MTKKHGAKPIDEDELQAELYCFELLNEMAFFSSFGTDVSLQAIRTGSALSLHQRDPNSAEAAIDPARVAWRALAGASELVGHAEHSIYSTSGNFLERLHMPIARSVLLAASKVIYLLGPDDYACRLVRAAKIANVEVAGISMLIGNLKESGHEPESVYPGLEAQRAALVAASSKVLIAAGLNANSAIKETDLIKAAAELLPRSCKISRTDCLVLWNLLSALSHSRSFPWGLGFGENIALDLLNCWLRVQVIFRHAWSLWHIRRGYEEESLRPPTGWEPDRNRYGPWPGN